MREACVDQGSEKTASVIEVTWQGQQTDEARGKTAVSKLANWQVSQPALSGGFGFAVRQNQTGSRTLAQILRK